MLRLDRTMPNLKASLSIVDDDHAITTTLSHIFRGFGHQVRTADDGFAALQQIRDQGSRHPALGPKHATDVWC